MLTEGIKRSIVQLKNNGLASREIAVQLGIGKTTVNNYLKSIGFNNRGPRVLFLDLETAPSIVAAFGRFDVNITSEQVLVEGGWLLSASWSWLGEDKIHGIHIDPDLALEENDYRVTQRIIEEVNKADIVIAHNGDRFDIPVLRTRCVVNKIPMKSFKTVDTLKIARKLKFNSNKLDSLGNYLEVGRKMRHEGIALWIDCVKGDKKALAKMLKYNKQDVKLLRDVYAEIRLFDNSAVNFGMYYNDHQIHCPSCGSVDVEPTGRTVVNGVSEYKEYVCNDCGKVSSSRKSETSKVKKQNLLRKVS